MTTHGRNGGKYSKDGNESTFSMSYLFNGDNENQVMRVNKSDDSFHDVLYIFLRKTQAEQAGLSRNQLTGFNEQAVKIVPFDHDEREAVHSPEKQVQTTARLQATCGLVSGVS